MVSSMKIGDRVKVLGSEDTKSRGLHCRYGHITKLEGEPIPFATVEFNDFAAVIRIEDLEQADKG